MSTSAAQRIAAVVAVVPGRILQGVFGAVGALRPAPKPLHPSGRLLPVTIRRFGLAAPDRIGVPWIDEAGETQAVARFSRAIGLPERVPDIHGLALTLDEAGGRADILMAGTGLGPFSRFILRPSLSPTDCTYSTLMPYRTSAAAILLAATPDPVDSAHFFLSFASPRGPWRVFGDLAVSEPDGALTGDESISFDPILHQLDGLAQYTWVTRLREGAYRAARSTRRTA